MVIRDKYNIIPISMALLLHALFVASLFFVFDFSRPVKAMPLAIEATLVSAESLDTPPPVAEPLPADPPPVEPEPNIDEQLRAAAEEKMRQEELARENQRILEEKEAERIKKARAEEERRKREEVELELKRAEAEKKRQEDIERQRKENERLRQEALAREAEDLRLREISEEEERIAAMNSGAMARYQFALQQKIMRNWVPPASAQPGIECIVDVRQLPGGDVVTVIVGRCNGDAAVRRSIEAAVLKASPLPRPSDPNLFRRDLRITFKPEE